MTSLFVLFACIFAFCNAAPEFRKIQTQIVSANETEFLRNHPEVKLIPLEKTVLRDGQDYKLRYTLGIPGDPLVTAHREKRSFTELDLTTVTIDYPGKTNFTQTITYIEADVVQDSPYGYFYISQGVLGDPSNITLQVILDLDFSSLISQVLKFDFDIKLYGH